MIRPIFSYAAMLMLGAFFVFFAACAVEPTPTPSECVDVSEGQIVNASCDRPGVEADPTPTPMPGAINSTGNANLGPGATVFSRVGGCGACHVLDTVGANGQVGPNLNGIGARLDSDGIYQSIINPNAVIAEDCPTGPCAAGLMPQNFSEILTAEQLDDLVSFLSNLQ